MEPVIGRAVGRETGPELATVFERATGTPLYGATHDHPNSWTPPIGEEGSCQVSKAASA